MSLVKVEKNTYTVEPLHQWDLNQLLEIRGLSLAKVPEVHFTNQSMDRAIVRQAKMDSAGVITVDVPNSLLQKPYDLKVYICGYTDDTFETHYTLHVPVKPREEPCDYVITDDPDVYSFIALENSITNAQQTLLESQQALEQAQNDLKSTLANITRIISEEVADQLPGVIDVSLTKSGKAADAKAAGDAIAGRARVIHDTYVGSGKSGVNYPNTLTADFEIKLAIIYNPAGVGGGSASAMLVVPKDAAYAIVYLEGVQRSEVLSWSDDGKTVSWYYENNATDAGKYQLNESGKTYNYILIG